MKKVFKKVIIISMFVVYKIFNYVTYFEIERNERRLSYKFISSTSNCIKRKYWNTYIFKTTEILLKSVP